MAEPLRLGGMALGNGLLVHGPTTWAAAVRRRDGSIGVASGRRPRLRGGVADAPGLRGVARLAEALAVVPLVKRALPEARLPFEDPRVALAAVAASAGGAAVRRRRAGAGAEVAVAALSLVPSLLVLRGGEVAAYHGVEHKAIAAYEQGDGDARAAAKEHDRCGSHLLAPLLAANVAGAALLRRAVVRPGEGGAARRPARRRGGRGGGLRLVRAPPRDARRPRAAAARPRAPARRGDARAQRRPARRRPRGAGRGPARGARRLSSGSPVPMLGAWPSRA